MDPPKFAASWIIPVSGRLTIRPVTTEDARADEGAMIESWRRGMLDDWTRRRLTIVTLVSGLLLQRNYGSIWATG
jgi:hypothetical protein